jgi:hypothetical protein
MELERILTLLADNGRRLETMLDAVSVIQSHWKPSDNDWSIVEVVNHLYDEERLDFRVRIDYTLHRPDQEWPEINPPNWVIERAYNEQDLGDSMKNFQSERAASLAWLAKLSTPDWGQTYQAPFGKIQAGELLAAWVAHDLLHLRQLVELQWKYILTEAQPYGVRYAGEW